MTKWTVFELFVDWKREKTTKKGKKRLKNHRRGDARVWNQSSFDWSERRQSQLAHNIEIK